MMIPQVNIQAYRRQYATQNMIAQVPIIILNENIRNPRFIGGHYALSREEGLGGSVACEYGCYKSNACPEHNIYCPLYFNGMNAGTGGNEWFA